MSTPAHTPPRISDRRWSALVVVAVAQLMVALDATIVTIALPTAQRALGFGDSDRQWVVTAYTVTFAGLLLVGGRVADRLGRRRAFLLALTGFAASSALAGAAPGFAVLIAGRALQGAFAAVLAPTALSLIAVTFPAPRERARAFGVYGAVASSGGAAGLLLGGVLSEYADWRWCLWVNVLVCAGALVAGRAVLAAAPAGSGSRPDLLSAVLATGGLAAVVLGCREAADHGWTAPAVWAPIALGLGALAVFFVRQGRSDAPLLPPALLADRARAGAYAATAAAVVGSYGLFLLLTFDLQVVRAWSPLQAGLGFLPLTLSVAASAYGFGSRLLPRVPARTLIVPGLLVAAAGLALLTRLTPGSSYLGLILPAEVLLGLGLGCVFTPAISVATSRVDPRQAGVAAALANTAMQVGGSVGTAVLNTVAVTATASAAAATAGAALVHGYAVALSVAAALLAAVAVLVLVLLRPPAADPSRQHPHATRETEGTVR
jgi:EmrB/QacA subfamily drug resistance transporter